ncbi:hypothetical protein FSP39_000618 [Pinctada imbricata]|uniref:Protein cramped-like n=1 Tax=Pinctada imbricata TaxID=66713 RepID=A0AA88YC10_PINIB|nr:hypothetical protein FSP39_000618 [Pinctada imbricata]
MPVDRTDVVVNDKQTSKGASKGEENCCTPKSARSAKNESSLDQQAVPRSGAFTRSRVIKRPKRDLSPPESPVKKSAPKENKVNTPEPKTKRQWELWSTQDKDAFFEALFEHGKDFDAIQNWIASKSKRKRVAAELIKNKDQVRHLYYRTWHKISKYLDFTDDMKKETQELYGLINYGALRKKINKGILSEKDGTKLKELVYKGIKTPVCNALKKVNNVDQKPEPSVKVPTKIHIEMTPKSNEAWATVQETAHNPRIRMMLRSDRTLSSVLKYLHNKWKSHRLKVKENMVGTTDDMTKVLTVFPHRDLDITPVTLECIKEQKLNLALNNYKATVTESPPVKGKKSDVKACTCDTSEEAPPVIFDSPHSAKGGREGNSVKTEVFSNPPSVDVSAMLDGENAMFPDAPFSTSKEDEESAGGRTIEMFIDTNHRGNDRVKLMSSPSGSKNPPQNIEIEERHVSSERLSDSSQDMEVLETRRTIAILENGITEEKSDACNLTLAELYLMFGKDEKLRLEYDWVQDKTALLVTNLSNVLRRLCNLANIEFTDISTKGGSIAFSPCRACGSLKARGKGSSKGQRSGGRSPLLSKSGGSDRMVDAGTQTAKTESTSQERDPVFRVPVCSPAFLQTKTPHTMASRQIINHNNLFPTQSKGIRKIRNNMRKPLQRNILPKSVDPQMLTIMRPIPTHAPHMTTVPINLQNGPMPPPINLQPGIHTTGIPGGTLVQLNVQPGSPPSTSQTPLTPSRSTKSAALHVSQDTPSTSTVTQLLNPISVEVPQHGVENPLSIENYTPAPTPTSSTVSPPNISSILDISLSNLPLATGVIAESSDRLIDLALGSSNTFSALLNPKDETPGLGTDSLLNTPTAKPVTSDGHDTTHQWLNGEENPELSFMNLLSDSPVKHVTSTLMREIPATIPINTQQVTPLFSESSRDSIMGRLDVDYSIQSMMNESSIDYAAKFMDLAAHITGNSENSLSNNMKKTDSNG